MVKPETRPRVLVRRIDQPALHRVTVHVPQLLQTLSFTVNIKRVESPLPDPIARFIVHRRRQPYPRERLPARVKPPIFAERRDDLECRSSLRFLHDPAGAVCGFGFDQKVKMLRHQHPADQKESHLGAKPLQNFHEVFAQAVALKKLRPAIGAARDELQLSRMKVASIKRHDAGKYNAKTQSERSAPAGDLVTQ